MRGGTALVVCTGWPGWQRRARRRSRRAKRGAGRGRAKGGRAAVAAGRAARHLAFEHAGLPRHVRPCGAVWPPLPLVF